MTFLGVPVKQEPVKPGERLRASVKAARSASGLALAALLAAMPAGADETPKRGGTFTRGSSRRSQVVLADSVWSNGVT